MASGVYISGSRVKVMKEVLEFPSGGTISPASATGATTQKITLTPQNISNKYVLLVSAPENALQTRLNIINGVEQNYGIDFEVTADNDGKTLSWASLGLDGVLQAGDTLIITYK